MGTIEYDERLDLKHVTILYIWVQERKTSRQYLVISGKRYYICSRGDCGLSGRGASRKFCMEKGFKIPIFGFVPCTRIPANACEKTLTTDEQWIEHAGHGDPS